MNVSTCSKWNRWNCWTKVYLTSRYGHGITDSSFLQIWIKCWRSYCSLEVIWILNRGWFFSGNNMVFGGESEHNWSVGTFPMNFTTQTITNYTVRNRPQIRRPELLLFLRFPFGRFLLSFEEELARCNLFVNLKSISSEQSVFGQERPYLAFLLCRREGSIVALLAYFMRFPPLAGVFMTEFRNEPIPWLIPHCRIIGQLPFYHQSLHTNIHQTNH